MEFKISNTDIFDEKLKEKVEKLLSDEIEVLVLEMEYRIMVIFNVNDLNDPRKETFYRDNVEAHRTYQKKKGEDVMYDIMSYQLGQVEKLFEKYEVSFFHTDIIGREIETGVIHIILEGKSTQDAKKSTVKVRSIMGNEAFTQKKLTKALNDYYSKQFDALLKAFDNNKLLAEVLESGSEADIQELYKIFIEKYGNFFATDEERKELADKLKDRMLTVFIQHGYLEGNEDNLF